MSLAGDFVQVLVSGYELTGDSNRLTIDDTRKMYDVTAFSDTVHNYVPGGRKISVEHLGYMTLGAAKSHEVLKGVNVKGIVSVFLGLNAAPALGNPVYSLNVNQVKYQTLPEIAKHIPFTARFAPAGGLGGWGVALTQNQPYSFTNTHNGQTVNNGAQSTKGGVAFLHVVQVASPDTYAFVIEGSATGAFGGEQTTLATFTLNASQLGSEYKAISGTIPQYVRYKATRTGSAGTTAKIAVSLVRF
jgi:hypothetical protein